MRYLFSALLLFFLDSLLAQNLVPNGGFEQLHNCPTAIKQLEFSKFWKSPNSGNPELFHTCGFMEDVLPYEGNGMAGAIFFESYRNGLEYMQVPLTDTLKANKFYCIQFYVLPSAKSDIFINKIGALVTKKQLSSPNWEPFIKYPQVYSQEVISDVHEWTEISGDFKAKGGEAFLSIGNFYESWYLKEEVNPNWEYNYSYYFIDEVRLWPKNGDCKTSYSLHQQPNQKVAKEHIVYFDKDEFEVTKSELERLNVFLNQLHTIDVKQLKIEGHTDSDASLEYNINLSRNRVEAVNKKIKSMSQITTYLIWQGESNPVTNQKSDSAMAKNRRVTIKAFYNE